MSAVYPINLLKLNFFNKKRTMKKVFFTIFLFAALATKAQVGIGVSAKDVQPSAQLEVKSTTKGLLIPRMTEIQKAAIVSPATGLLVYQTDGTKGFYYYDGSAWKSGLGPQGAIGPIGLQGPAGLNGATGPQGATGLAGAQGIQGVKGDKGDKGDRGDNGNSDEATAAAVAAGVSAGAAAASAVAAAASATSSATSSAASAVSSANAEAAAEEAASYARYFIASDTPPTETLSGILRIKDSIGVNTTHEFSRNGDYNFSGSISNDNFQITDTGNMVVNSLQTPNITTTTIDSTDDLNINFSHPTGNSVINIGRNSTNSNPFSANSINIGTLNDPVYINSILYNPFYFNSNYINQLGT